MIAFGLNWDPFIVKCSLLNVHFIFSMELIAIIIFFDIIIPSPGKCMM